MLCCSADVASNGIRHADEQPIDRRPSETEKALLAEISQLGGEERIQGAEGALKAFRASLDDLVRTNPRAYGAEDNPESQRRLVHELFDSISSSFLLRTVDALRRNAGYVMVCRRWIHRAVFTFIGFGLLAAAVLPLCAVSLMSASAWGWLPGVLGVAASVLIGLWILGRIRSR